MLSFTIAELKLDAATCVRLDPGDILGESKNDLCLKAQQKQSEITFIGVVPQTSLFQLKVCWSYDQGCLWSAFR